MNAQGISGINAGVGKYIARLFNPVKISAAKAKLTASNGKRNYILLGIALLLSGILMATAYIFSTERQADTTSKHSLNPRLVDQQGTADSSSSSSNSTGSNSTGNGQSANNQNSSGDNSSSDNNQTGSSTNSTTVTVNGQPVNVPANGSYSATIDNTTVSGNTQQSSDSKGGSVSNSSTNSVTVHSQ